MILAAAGDAFQEVSESTSLSADKVSIEGPVLGALFSIEVVVSVHEAS